MDGLLQASPELYLSAKLQLCAIVHQDEVGMVLVYRAELPLFWLLHSVRGWPASLQHIGDEF